MADCPHTIGVEFGTRIIEVSGQKIKLQIWDTVSSEETSFHHCFNFFKTNLLTGRTREIPSCHTLLL